MPYLTVSAWLSSLTALATGNATKDSTTGATDASAEVAGVTDANEGAAEGETLAVALATVTVGRGLLKYGL